MVGLPPYLALTCNASSYSININVAWKQKKSINFFQELLSILDRTKLGVGHCYAVVLCMYMPWKLYLSLIVSRERNIMPTNKRDEISRVQKTPIARSGTK